MFLLSALDARYQVTEQNIESIDFLAFTVICESFEVVLSHVDQQLLEWWKFGIDESYQPKEITPFGLSKLTNPESKIVHLFECENSEKFTILESNLRDGYCSLTHMLSRSLPDVQFLSVRSSPVDKSDFPLEEFIMFKNGNSSYSRLILAALTATSWRFENIGKIQAFEEKENYKKRAIKQRFSRELMLTYLNRLEIDVFAIRNLKKFKRTEAFKEKKYINLGQD